MDEDLACIPGTNFVTEVTDDMNFAIGESDEITRRRMLRWQLK
jgi:hypothetical protein